MDVVWITLLLSVMAGMWWVAYKMEPHWSARDGKRFLCNAQEIENSQPIGRPRETRVLVMPDGLLHVSRKRMMRRRHSLWILVGKSPEPPRKMNVYVAQLRQNGQDLPAHIVLRVPSKSRCVPVLDEVLAESQLKASRRAPRSAARAEPPDPG